MAIFPITQPPLIVPGLEEWLDGNDPAGNGVQPAHLSSIATWVDKSGRFNNATQASGANQFLFNANYSGNKGSLTLNGTSSFMTAPVILTSLHTVFIVHQPSSLPAPDAIIFHNGTTASSGFGYMKRITNRTILFGGANYKVDSAINLNKVLISFVWNGGTSVMWVNGSSTALTNAATAPIMAAGSLTIGADNGGASLFYAGTISEILIYNNPLTTANRQYIERYLSNKWGIAI